MGAEAARGEGGGVDGANRGQRAVWPLLDIGLHIVEQGRSMAAGTGREEEGNRQYNQKGYGMS